MPRSLPLIRSYLYAPGNNSRLLEKVVTAGADAVIFDLEDAVPVAQKAAARGLVAETVRARAGMPRPAVFVRINHPESGLAEDDVRAAVQPGLTGLRLPKMEDAATVREIAAWVDCAEAAAGLPAGSVVLTCSLESASGVYRALEIATAHPRVLNLVFGSGDFERDLGISPDPAGLATLYARSQIVLASRVAGLRPPTDTVFRQLDDAEGLERETRLGRQLGFFGKSAIHPRQIAIIHAVYTPAQAELAHARAVVAAAREAEARGIGALQIGAGDFVDIAVVRRAEDILRLAEQLGAD